VLYKHFSNVVDSENIFTVNDTLTHKEPSVRSVVTYILLVVVRVLSK